MIDFFVIGTPGAQGSKRHVGNGIMIESSKKCKPWREAVKWAFHEKYGTLEKPVVSGPVKLCVTFYFHRPKTVKREWPATAPDIDKVIRATADALTQAGAWEDDSRVVALECFKEYAAGSISSGAHIKISPMLSLSS